MHYTLFDKHGIGLSEEHGAIFILSLVISFPLIICFDSFYPNSSAILLFAIFVAVNLILFFAFVFKSKHLKIIEKQKPIKVYEVIITILISLLIVSIGFFIK